MQIWEDQYAHIEILFTDINMQALSMAFTLFVLFMSDGAHSADFDLRAAPPFRLSACEFAVSTQAYRGNVLITTLRDAAGCGLARRPPLPGGTPLNSRFWKDIGLGLWQKNCESSSVFQIRRYRHLAAMGRNDLACDIKS